MYKLVVVSILFLAVHATATPVYAEENHDTQQGYTSQLHAIKVYLKRLVPSSNRVQLSDEDLRQLIIDGASWLQQAQESNGHFAYEYHPYDDTYSEDDNIVRQAGALYSLGEVSRRDTDGRVDLAETIESAIYFFESISIEGESDGKTFRCISGGASSKRCRLGATSLALTGMLGYVERYPDKSNDYDDLIKDYATYILAMKKPEQGFRDNYRSDLNTQRDSESPFSNGEALLALVRYYQYEPEEDVWSVIDDTFTYLEKLEFDSPLHLWIMAALKDMYVIDPQERYLAYAYAFNNWKLPRLTTAHRTTRNYCAPNEGLVSSYSLLEGYLSDSERKLLRDEIDFWNTHNSALQVGEDDVYRVVWEEDTLIMKKAERPEVALGGYLTGHNDLTQRIDFTQHCITAYVQTLVDIDGQAI